MFCPKCRYEYREGIAECPDCAVKLIDKLSPEPEPQYQELITVLATSDQAELLMAKALLEDAEIDFFAKGDGIVDLFGAGRLGFNPVVGALEIQVRPEDVEDAKVILFDLIEGKDSGTEHPDSEAEGEGDR